MNLKLAELLESVPLKFREKRRTAESITYRHANKEIYIDWFDNGQPYIISYWENDDYHRPINEGPAVQRWDISGRLIEETYWENGRQRKPEIK